MDGYRLFQCKIGSNPEENAKCVKACREVLDTEDILAVDANGGIDFCVHFLSIRFISRLRIHADGIGNNIEIVSIPKVEFLKGIKFM